MTTGIYKRTPEHLAAMSKSLKNSEAAKAKADAQRGISLSPEHCAAISKALSGIPKPPRTPEHCAAITKGLQESDAIKAHGESMRGGNDIVDHHIIYDHADLSKHTIKITRSIHMKLHQLFRKYRIEIPRINIKEI